MNKNQIVMAFIKLPEVDLIVVPSIHDFSLNGYQDLNVFTSIICNHNGRTNRSTAINHVELFSKVDGTIVHLLEYL